MATGHREGGVIQKVNHSVPSNSLDFDSILFQVRLTAVMMGVDKLAAAKLYIR